MQAHRLVFAVALAFSVFVLSSCGGDSTGASGFDLDGTWSYEMTFSEAGCEVTGATLNLAHTSQTLTGTVSGGQLVCPEGSVPFGDTFEQGQVSGSDVSFVLFDYVHSGTVENRSKITGTANGRFERQIGPSDVRVISETGVWSARRQ